MIDADANSVLSAAGIDRPHGHVTPPVVHVAEPARRTDAPVIGEHAAS